MNEKEEIGKQYDAYEAKIKYLLGSLEYRMEKYRKTKTSLRQFPIQ